MSNFSVLKSLHDQTENFNIDDLSSYSRGSGLLNYSVFSYPTEGTKPFIDEHLLTFIWRNLEDSNTNILAQIVFEDDHGTIRHRIYSKTGWTSWSAFHD